MPFVWRMAWRETRAGWRHFVYFLVSIAVGVGALVTVSVFAANVEQTVVREARGLHGGDLEIRLSRPMSAEGRAVLDALGARVTAITHVSEMIAMAAVSEGRRGPEGQVTQIIELKAVEPGYPLYGAVVVEPLLPLAALLGSDPRCLPQSCFGAVVQQSLLIRLGLAIGDRIKVGHAQFTIRGMLSKEPDRMANAFSLGPRVLISAEGLRAADLIKPGSRVRERYLLRTATDTALTPLVHELRGRLARDSARVSTFREAQPQLKRFLEQLARYLGLVGLTALFVGGIGVATTVHAFIREKLHSIAILKTLGATTAVVVRVYVAQAVALALVGSLAGVVIGLLVQGSLPSLLRSVFATDLLDQLDFQTRVTGPGIVVAAKGTMLGVLTTLLFTLWPVLTIRDIRPAMILRRVVTAGTDAPPAGAPVGRRRARWGLDDSLRFWTAAGILAGLAALAIWQAGSWRVGATYAVGLLGAVLVLTALARWLVALLRSWPPPRSLLLRYSLRNVTRPGSQAVGVILAIGLALMVMVAVSLLERALLEEVTTKRPDDAPTIFFIDIQPDQRDGVLNLLHEHTGALNLEALPLLRTRLSAVNGVPVTVEEMEEAASDKADERRRSWYQTREYVVTMLEGLPKDNQLVKGTWWKPGEVPSAPQVSIEEEAARNLGLEVGSTLAMDIQGAIVTAQVRSIRKVEWGNFSTNFYMIFSPGSLDGAPFTYVATVQTHPDQDVPLQRALVARYPNVTGIHMGDVVDSFSRMLDRLALAIRAVAWFSVLSGALVMATALSATRYRRLYESVVLKAVGATRGLLMRSFAVEYAVVGAMAGLVGIVLANLFSWGILTYLFDLDWSFQPRFLLISLGVTVLLTMLTGFASTFRLLGKQPLPILRQE